MGRLIDANDIEFKKKFCKRFCTNLADTTNCPRKITCEVMKWIDEQPTAYDVDKVVEKLENEIERNPYHSYYKNTYERAVKNAISIVKGAVKDA